MGLRSFLLFETNNKSNFLWLDDLPFMHLKNRTEPETQFFRQCATVVLEKGTQGKLYNVPGYSWRNFPGFRGGIRSPDKARQ